MLPLCCTLSLVAAIPVSNGKPLDPRTTVLTPYLLPDAAAVDGPLTAWAGIPALPAEDFKLNQANETLMGNSDFAPSLRVGMKQGGSDLYFLVLVRDAHLRAEDSFNGLAGDCLELYLDFGREERDRGNPDWYKAPYSNSYYPRQEPPRCLGQIVVRPPTLQGPSQVFKSPNTEKWNVDVQCTLVDGGVAYAVRVATASVLAELKMAQLPAVLGVDVGFLDQDYAPRLQAENWSNDRGLYRLFGDWVDDVVPTNYGLLATHPEPAAKDEPLTPLPKPLRELFGDHPTAGDIRHALVLAPPERTAQLVTWAGLQGVVLETALVRQLMKSNSPDIREACLAVLAFTGQQAGGHPCRRRCRLCGWPISLCAIHRQSVERAAGAGTARATARAARARRPDRGLHRRGRAGEGGGGRRPGPPRCGVRGALRELAKAPVHDNGYHQTYMGKAQTVSAARYFFGVAREALLLRTEPITIPHFSPVRQFEAKNTDLERFIPADGNTVYFAKDLLRKWPDSGPRDSGASRWGRGRAPSSRPGDAPLPWHWRTNGRWPSVWTPLPARCCGVRSWPARKWERRRWWPARWWMATASTSCRRAAGRRKG